MLGIGAVFGGPELEETMIKKRIAWLMNIVSDQNEGFVFGSQAALNIVFHVPGSKAPDVGYQGIRDAKFSQKQKLLMIQVAVPWEIVECKDECQLKAFLIDSLREAGKIGTESFEKKGMMFSEADYQDLIDTVERQFLESS